MGKKKNFFSGAYRKLMTDVRIKLAKRFPQLVDKTKLDGGLFYSASRKVMMFLAKLATLRAEKLPRPEKTVLEYDWDYLIVIDACRHDLFEEVYGEADYKVSRGSDTREWRNKNFTEDYDIVYVSANPAFSNVALKIKFDRVPFTHLEEVFMDGWDEELKTVPPEEVTKAALRCYEEYPDKRMIVHYLQPHYPFVGEKKMIVEGVSNSNDLKEADTPWDRLGRGAVSEEEVWQAYKDNLKLVMEEVNKLKKELDGKVVLTSDHGNCKGEYGIYSHPNGSRIPELVKVPYVEF